MDPPDDNYRTASHLLLAKGSRIALLNGLLTGSTAAASSTEIIKASGVLDSILAMAGINAV